MKIRCIDGSNTKLIEGQIYDAIYILGDSKLHEQKWASIGVSLYNGDSYNSIYRFETLDGKPLNTIYIDERVNLSELRICRSNISFDDLLKTWIKYVGGNASKYFVHNNYYKVSNINTDVSYNDSTSLRIKIEGFEHFWTGSESFTLPNKEELRNLKIDSINGKEVITNNFTRKFDAISTEERLKVLMNALIKARREFAKNDFKGITMEEFIVSSDQRYGITLEDIEEFKSLSIMDLFK